MVVWHLKQIEKVKKFNKWLPHELTTSQKHCCFQVLSSLILCNDSESFLDQLATCNKVYFTQQPVATMSVVGLRRSCKALSKTKLTHTHTHTHKDHGHCGSSVTGLICYSFLNPGKSFTSENYAQQISAMHQNPQCLQLVLVHRKGLILSCNNTWPHVVQPILQNLNELGCKVLPHLPFSPDLWPTDYHFLKQFNNFCRENSSIAIRKQKMLSKCSSNPRAQIFMLQEKAYFFFAKMCLL